MKGVDYQNDAYQDLIHKKAMEQALPVVEEALRHHLFDVLEKGCRISELEMYLNANASRVAALLEVLKEMGLVIIDEPFVSNAPVSSKYLVTTSLYYSGPDFLAGEESPKYVAEKLAPILEHFRGSIGVEEYPGTLCSLVFIQSLGQLGIRVNPPTGKEVGEGSDLIFVGVDNPVALEKRDTNQILGILGSFEGKGGLQSAIKRYERTTTGLDETRLSARKVEQWANKTGRHCTPLLPLSEQTSVLFVSKNLNSLKRLAITPEQQVMGKIKSLPIQSATFLDPKDVVTAEWVVDHCRFGCSSYGTKCCPPNSPTCDESKTRFQAYSKAILIEGQPPGRSFQQIMLQAEKIAFKQGYYKAFVYWAGPCDLCTECKPPDPPLTCTATRPSMESAGIDVFATVRKQGIELRTLRDRNEYVKYFGLLLLE